MATPTPLLETTPIPPTIIDPHMKTDNNNTLLRRYNKDSDQMRNDNRQYPQRPNDTRPPNYDRRQQTSNFRTNNIANIQDDIQAITQLPQEDQNERSLQTPLQKSSFQ